MPMNGGRKRPVTFSRAEEIAANALAFLAVEPPRLIRFLSMTGMSPEELRAHAEDPSTLGAVLDHLASDESLLLVFTSETGIAPEDIGPARHLLAGGAGGGGFD